MLFTKSFSTILLLVVLLAVNSQATTYVGQHIEKDTKWLKANSPYIITIDLSILKDATLEIEAGTKVIFSKETRLTVSGNLIAQGTKSQKISFTGLNNDNWNGFSFTKDCNDYDPETKKGVSFNYCTFVGTGEAPAHLIRSKGCNINLSNSSIEGCYTAIQVERQAEIWVTGSSFKNCNRVINVRNTSIATMTKNKMTTCNSIMLGGTTTFKDNILKNFTSRGRHSGIVVWMLGGGIVDISGNQFIKFDDYAIKLQKISKRSSFLVHNNSFKNNKTNLHLSCKYYNKGTCTIENNNFFNYKQYHVKLFAPCSEKEFETLSIGANYWGKLSNDQVKEATFDHHLDEKITAEVEYAEALKKSTL